MDRSEIFFEISHKMLCNILLNKLRKCSIIPFLISPNQEKDGNMSTLFDIWNTIQTQLFPWLEQELDPLSEKEREFVQVVSLLDLPSHMKEYRWRGFGRKKKSRISMAKAFVAKSVYKFETTDILIEYLKDCKNIRRLCGWELSSRDSIQRNVLSGLYGVCNTQPASKNSRSNG